MRALIIAFSMYSKIPMPQIAWEEKTLSRALCFFPLVGAAAGLLLLGWMRLSAALGFGAVLSAAVAAAIPIALSGGIHLDGFCDTCDALASRQDRARKLEIMKDPHAGAFAVLGCGLYLLLLAAAWHEAAWPGRAGLALALSPVLSRSLSGLFAALLPNARGGGLLWAFTAPMDVRHTRLVMGLWIAACGAAMLGLDPWTGGFALLGAGVAGLYYVSMARRQFGGITGDLAGFFLQLCELCMVLGAALGQRIEVLV